MKPLLAILSLSLCLFAVTACSDESSPSTDDPPSSTDKPSAGEVAATTVVTDKSASARREKVRRLLDRLGADDRKRTVLLTSGDDRDDDAVAAAEDAGATALTVPSGDPRADKETVRTIADVEPRTTIALGVRFGSPRELGWKVATAATGAELPGGGQLVLHKRRMVAMYGTPGTGSLGVLGEQPMDGAIERAEKLAGEYEPLTSQTVVPTFEVIATVAGTNAGSDGNFSNEVPVETLEPWVRRAEKEGMYVVLDLQPGRSSFLKQAKQYRDLLVRPNVGLALDPEWRLGPKQKPLEQIGSVDAAEVNATMNWLADLTQRKELPQKLLVLHQFRTSMIANRSRVRTDRDEVKVLIHADGQGPQSSKRATWQSLHKAAPNGVAWGWKNFYDEDAPMLNPKQTYAVTPRPDFVSYQ